MIGDLGRLVPPDWDHLSKHPMAPRLLEPPADATQRRWVQPLAYVQDGPRCTGFSAAQLMSAVEFSLSATAVRYDGDAIYQWANAHDGLPQPHDGSFVRDAFDCLTQVGADELATSGTPKIDRLASYVWTQNVDDIVKALLTTGPVVVGTNWYEGMMSLDAEFIAHVTGRNLGGHAWMIHGVDLTWAGGVFRGKNQWDGWGWQNGGGPDPGDFLIPIADVGRLMAEDGECALAVCQFAA